jgi:hypothetical protein
VPVVYGWTMPSLMPLLLPWLGLLALLAARPNRNGRAWWIWAPVLVCAGVVFALRALGEVVGPGVEVIDTFGQLTMAGAFGLAALWLLGSLFSGKHGLIVFLGALLVQSLVSAAVLLVALQADTAIEEIGLFIFLFLVGAGISLALNLAGQARRRLRVEIGFSLWVLIFLLVGWLLGVGPFIVMTQLSGGFAPAGGMLIGAVCVAMASFVLLTPFLVLASANSFYRARLQAMFGLSGLSTAPPLLARSQPPAIQPQPGPTA